jgi:type IV pilus assembly protein PilC
MPMPSALAASANLTGNAFFSRQIAEAAEVLASGATLSQALSSTNVFSQQFLSMVHTVEATGNLSATLTETAESYESEAEIRIHQSVNFLLLRNIDSKRKDDLRRPMRT